MCELDFYDAYARCPNCDALLGDDPVDDSMDKVEFESTCPRCKTVLIVTREPYIKMTYEVREKPVPIFGLIARGRFNSRVGSYADWYAIATRKWISNGDKRCYWFNAKGRMVGSANLYDPTEA